MILNKNVSIPKIMNNSYVYIFFLNNGVGEKYIQGEPVLFLFFGSPFALCMLFKRGGLKEIKLRF